MSRAKTKAIGKNKPPKEVREPKPKPKAPARKAPTKASDSAAGRKFLLTPEVEQIIIAAVKAGNYLSTAADFAGVSAKTVYEWISRGEGRDPDRPSTPELAAFAAAIKKAEAHGKIAALQRIQEAAKGRMLREKRTVTRVIQSKDGTPQEVTETVEKYFPSAWQADAWMLERRFPEEWGRRDRHELSSPGSDKVEVNLDIQSLISKIYGEPVEDHGEQSPDSKP